MTASNWSRRQFAQRMASLAFAGVVRPQELPGSPSKASPFPLSVMLWTVWPDLPFERRLANVARAGYSNVELVGEYASWSAADFDRAVATRKQLGMNFDATAGLHHGIGDPMVRDAFLAELEGALVSMERLGCPSLIVLSGNVVPGLSREVQHLSCVEGLKRAASVIEGRQIGGRPVRLLLECIDPEENPRYLLESATEAIAIVRAVNHPQVQFLYDLFHEQIAEGNLIEKLDKHIDVIGLIHVADVPGRHQPGTGEINYVNIFRKLADLKYRHVVAMEFKPTGDALVDLRRAHEMVANATATNASETKG